MAVEKSWASAKNILCVRLDTIGDVLMTMPAIRALKESIPGARVTLWTCEAGAQITPLLPQIDDVMVYDAPWMKATVPRLDAASDLKMLQRLRSSGYDGVVMFTVYSQSPLPAALMCYFADIPLRLAHCRENPSQLLTHWVPDPEPHQRLCHEVRRHLDLVRTIGCQTRDERIPLTIPEDARQSVKRMLQDLGLRDSRKWVVIHPGASAPSRRYPPESIAKVAGCLVKNSGLQVLFTGSRDEVDLAEEIRYDMKAPSLSLAGTLDLGHLAALLSHAPVLISNNTGPVHIAAAVGTPVVDLYALTNPQHTPWGVPHRVLYHDVPCKFCYKSICPEGHHNCLRLVTPEAVVNAVLELLQDPIHVGGHQNVL